METLDIEQPKVQEGFSQSVLYVHHISKTKKENTFLTFLLTLGLGIAGDVLICGVFLFGSLFTKGHATFSSLEYLFLVLLIPIAVGAVCLSFFHTEDVRY